jgi:tRNA (guanine-N7-)-methyltransferase
MRQNSTKPFSRRQWSTAGILLPDEAALRPVRWGDLFPDAHSRIVEIEIGAGKGTFLLARARARADVNLLGIEYARAYAAYAADRTRRNGVKNAKLLCADAGAFIRDCIPDRSVWRVHLYFPDPWPKRKHRRRRLVQPEFVAQLRRILQPGGQFLVVTDHRDYFEQMRRVLTDAPGLARCEFPDFDTGGDDSEETLVGTNFERKYRRQGKPFHRLALLRYE